MKTLLITIALALLAPQVYSAPIALGPKVVGNGGGGVRESNGVYKTFYSAGLYVVPQVVTDIPGAELYTQTVLSIVGNGGTTSKLLSSALPIGKRKFFNIVEEKMDQKVMERLLEEYARVIKQPEINFTLFAITDIENEITYLLPSFYKLSEIEQAAILFHEAYWIMNPTASYDEVVAAESAFQEFLELKEAGQFSIRLPRLLGELVDDRGFSLRAALEADTKLKTTPSIISANGEIKVSTIMIGQSCEDYYQNRVDYRGGAFYAPFSVADINVMCNLTPSFLAEVVVLAKKYPTSFFIKELTYFLSQGNTLSFHDTFGEIKAKTQDEFLAKQKSTAKTLINMAFTANKMKTDFYDKKKVIILK